MNSADDKKWFETLQNRQSAITESRLNNLSATLQAYIDARQQEQRTTLEAVETRLLTEFHKCIQSHAQAIRAIDLELENVKERVQKLEPKQ